MSDARTSRSEPRRWLREPLVHFLALGFLLFLVHGALRRAPARDHKPTQIALTLDDLRQLEVGFTAQWQRRPTPEEMTGLLQHRIREEVLYREAIALGLDKADSIVKRRMAQKMEFLAEDVSGAHEPTSEELEEWFAKNAKRFALPGRITFRHRYFSPDRRGARAHDDAVKAVERLARKPEDSPAARGLGDPFMFHSYLADRSSVELAKDFGPAFAQAVFKLDPGGWKGPVESGYGWHLVFVEGSTPGRVPELGEIEADVKTAWLAARKAEAWDKAYATMLAKYELVLPAQADANGEISPLASVTR